MRRNPSKIQELQAEVDDLGETLDSVGSAIDEALDPSLTREQVIKKLQDIQDLLPGEDEDDDGTDNNDETES